MPEISRFYGMIIAMYYNDHPPAHFHVRFGADRAIIGIETMQVIEGRLPPRALGLALEWARMHQEELRTNWVRAARHVALMKIAPLE